MIREPSENALDQAAKRLEGALARLEKKLAAGGTVSLFDADRAQLAAQLDRARERERELEAAGAAASDALGRAIAEIRDALAEPVAGE